MSYSASAKSTLQHDNEQRVTLWEFAPVTPRGGTPSADHVVPLTTGKLSLLGPGGVENEANLTAGISVRSWC